MNPQIQSRITQLEEAADRIAARLDALQTAANHAHAQHEKLQQENWSLSKQCITYKRAAAETETYSYKTERLTGVHTAVRKQLLAAMDEVKALGKHLRSLQG